VPAPGKPPPRKQIKRNLFGWGGCHSIRTQSLTVVAYVILQCTPCVYECRCMSDIQFVCQFFNLMVIQTKSARGLSV